MEAEGNRNRYASKKGAQRRGCRRLPAGAWLHGESRKQYVVRRRTRRDWTGQGGDAVAAAAAALLLLLHGYCKNV